MRGDASVYWRLLRENRDFRLLYFGTLISLGGDWFLTVALLDLVLQLTGSATLASVILLCQTLPIFLFTPHAGHLIDRVDRRKLMVVVDLLRAVACLLPLVARTPALLPFAYAGVILISIGSAYFEPASQAALPNLVSQEDLGPANVLMGSTWGTMLAVGAGLGGAVTMVLGRDASFVFDAFSFLVSAALLWRMRGRFSEWSGARASAGHAEAAASGFFASMRETLHFAKKAPRVLGLLTVKGGYGLGAGVVAMLSVFGREIFEAGAFGIGLLFAARGAGALFGPFLVRAVIRSDDAQYRAIVVCVLAFGAGYAALAFSPTLAAGVAAITFAHLGGGAAWQISSYGLQRETPDHIRGRVFAADYGFVTLTMAISGLGTGIAADRFGAPAATLGTAAICLLFAVVWTTATWRLWRAAPLLLFFLIGCHREPAKPPVVLISIDTLRSDRANTPNIRALAGDGITFERAFSHVPLTLPSHASIFTGLLPAHHGVRDNAGYVLDGKTPTIASMLRSNGYATGGAVSAYVLRASTNIGSGFETWDDDVPFVEGAPMGNLARPGDRTVGVMRQWIASRASQPFFAFVHLFEPHAPYLGSYEHDVRLADQHLGALLQSLREAKLYDQSLIILLSDHGEGLGDHGEAEHGVLLYREALQVPLIVKLPNNERAGTRVRGTAQLVDVLPTIAEITGMNAPKGDGRSLLEAGPERPVFSETFYPRLHLGWSDLRSVIAWPHHLIDGPKPELYDLDADSREVRDLRESDRRSYARVRNILNAAPSADVAAPRVDPEEARKLAALGYLSAQAPAKRSNLNPRDRLGDLNALKDVSGLMESHRYAESAALLEQLLARNPGWSDLRDQLGVAYRILGDRKRAEEVYREAIRVTPELAPAFALSLASLLLERGALDEAEAHAKLAIGTNPEGAHEVLAHVAVRRGELERALNEAQLAQNDFLLAQVHMFRNEPRAALPLLQRIHGKGGPLPRGYYRLAGDVFLALGRPDEARVAFEEAAKAERRR
jgi:MFS family permease/tetratricopeptide (TPR) repeat protein